MSGWIDHLRMLLLLFLFCVFLGTLKSGNKTQKKGEKEESHTQSHLKLQLLLSLSNSATLRMSNGVPTALPGNGTGTQLGHSRWTWPWPRLGAQAKVHKAPADHQQCTECMESWNWKSSPGSWGPSSSPAPALCAPVPHPGVFNSSRMSQFPGQLVWIKACQPLQWGHFSWYVIQTCPVSSAPAPSPGEQSSASKGTTVAAQQSSGQGGILYPALHARTQKMQRRDSGRGHSSQSWSPDSPGCQQPPCRACARQFMNCTHSN